MGRVTMAGVQGLLPPPTPEPNDLVRSVSRALRTLEEVSRSPAPLPVKAIARRAGLNLSTTYHLVRTLAYEGYLVRDAAGCYSLGVEVARRYRELVTAFGRGPDLRSVLVHLAGATGHSAYLASWVHGQVTITDLVEGRASPYLEDLEPGLPAAAHATAAGKALLATLPNARRRQYLGEQGMPAFTPLTTTDPDLLELELGAVRPGRPVVEHGQFRERVSCAAVLVPRDDPTERWWALVVSARDDDVPRAVTEQLIAAAGDLAAR
jgi:DNA-binding IclR family transcriptional regulator